jgi:protein-tyrosine phosphatase
VAKVIFLCTGNAARSVMGGAIARSRHPDIEVVTAGTHVVEGMPMSWRTRDALAGIGYRADGHRSTQLRERDVAESDLIVAMAGEHVAYVRRAHPEAAARTATLKRLARDLGESEVPLGERLAALMLATSELEDWEDVVDPAGGELEDFEACAREIDDLLAQVLPRCRTLEPGC